MSDFANDTIPFLFVCVSSSLFVSFRAHLLLVGREEEHDVRMIGDEIPKAEAVVTMIQMITKLRIILLVVFLMVVTMKSAFCDLFVVAIAVRVKTHHMG